VYVELVDTFESKIKNTKKGNPPSSNTSTVRNVEVPHRRPLHVRGSHASDVEVIDCLRSLRMH
jgi:hypothetical protein